MSWFTKKKDSKDEKKESSVLAIETMHDDLENSSKTNKEKKTEEKKEKKPLKKSPFLMKQGDEEKVNEKESAEKKEPAEKDAVKKEEPNLPHPASVVATEEVQKQEEKTEEKKEGVVIPDEKLAKKSPVNEQKVEEEKDEKEEKMTPVSKEEEAMEKLVKAEKEKPTKKKKSGILNLKKKPAKKKVAEQQAPPEKQETPEESKKKISILSEKKVEETAVLPAKLAPHEVSKKETNKSPFGVPKAGITVADKKKVEKIQKAKEKNKNKKKINKPLLIFAVVIFVLTMGGVGFNYYRNSTKQPPIETPPMVIKEELTKPAYQMDNFADAAIELKTSKELFLTDLKAFIAEEKAKDATKFQNGVFIRPLQNETEYISGEEVLSIFGSKDQAINSFLDKPIVVFATEEEVEVEIKEEKVEEATPNSVPATDKVTVEVKKEKKNVIKLSLMLELKKESNPGDVIERLTEIETTFPGTLKSLMIEESPNLVNEKIIFGQATPEKRELIHALRYFNFSEGNTTQAIEWGSLLYKNRSYIFFTTSKKSTESLMKALY